MPVIPPAVVLMLLGSVTAFAALPMLFGLVRPNRFYGIRVAAAFESEQNWYTINRFGGSRLLRFGMVVGITGLLLQQNSQLPFWVPILCLFGTLVLLLLTIQSIKHFASSV